MAASGEGQIQRVIRDLHDAVSLLAKEYSETGEPITDDSTNLQKFSYKFEYLLQFDQKDKTTFLGTRKDYWDFFSDCLAKIKGANDGVRFVKSIPELKTSLGKGRAFIRYSLVHQRLADTLQQCLMNQKVTSDWYYSRSPFLKPDLSGDIVGSLYELNEVQFDVASRGHDLDSAWPTFARRTLGMTSSPSHMWKAPSRSSSINSLASSFSQAPEFPCSPEFGNSLLSESAEPLSDSAIATVDELRLELDQSELKQRELAEHVLQLGSEATELRDVVVELQRQLDVSLAAQSNSQELQLKLEVLAERERSLAQDLEILRAREAVKDAASQEILGKLAAAESKNEELMAKLDGVLEEKGQRTASQFDSAQKIHELLDGLKEAERGRMEALAHAEEKRMQAERLSEDLRTKQQALADGETKMATLTEKGTKLMKQAEEQRNAMDKLQEELSVREKEASGLQKDLQDLQHCLEAMEHQAMEDNKRALEEREVLQKKLNSLKESLEGQVQNLKAKLRAKEADLIASVKKIQHLEAEAKKTAREKEGLSGNVVKLEASMKDQTKKVNEYKEECSYLKELNNKLLKTVEKNEEAKKELMESKAVLENDLAVLRASEKQLRGQLDDAKVTVDEREHRMREENRNLDEKLQKAIVQVKELDSTVLKLEQENTDLKEECFKSKDALTAAQEGLCKFTDQLREMERSLELSRCNEANLTLQLKEQHSQLEDRERLCEELQERLDEEEARGEELEAGKAEAERALEKQGEMMERLESEKKLVEKAQLEMSTCRAKEAQDMGSKVALLEEQLGLNVKQVSRLQGDVVDLKAKLLVSEEEKVKIQTKLEITEASRTELQTLTEHLKKQAEEQNRNHVNELLQSKQQMQEMSSELEAATSSLAKTSADFAAAQEDLAVLKTQNEQLVSENAETREGLHRANTEMAELGMNICKLTAEREEAQVRWAAETTRIHELKERGEREADHLNASMAALRQENASLREELLQMEKLPETVLELKEMLDKSEKDREVAREETAAVKFQMSTEVMEHQNHVKSVNEELESLKVLLKSESGKTSSLEVKVAELEGVKAEWSQLMEEKDARIAKAESLIRCGEEEIKQLKERVTCVQESLAVTQTQRDGMKEEVERLQCEATNQQIRMAAEIDDLSHVKTTLEERLIELIREKDVLWQKSDALEFEQKQRAEEQWWLVDREASHCLSCNGQFTWWLRKHHCRLCGRIFCYYCSNNFVSTRSGGKRERCCRECYTQHAAVVERFTRSEVSGPADTPAAHTHTHAAGAAAAAPPYIPTPSVTVIEPSARQDDMVFDIITDEEVNGLYDSDTHSQTTAESQDGEAESRAAQDPDVSGESEEQKETPPLLQDAEIHLLKSGELSSSVLLHIDEVEQFGDTSRELFVKSSCYSVISVSVHEHGRAVGWVFSSEPKSISFSVVFRESSNTPEEQAKVLIPLTRCNAHKETIQGQLKARNPGIYTLIFDNSYSRFISKKVNYHLTTEKPVIYDGSDCP